MQLVISDEFQNIEMPIHNHSEAILNDFSDSNRIRVKDLNEIRIGLYSPITVGELWCLVE